MNLEQLLDSLRADAAFMRNVTHWETIPAQPARLAPFPPGIDARIPAVLRARGVQALYTHQREAVDADPAGRACGRGHADGLGQDALL